MLKLNEKYSLPILYLILIISIGGIAVELFRIELLYIFSDIISPVIYLYESIEFRFLLLDAEFYNHYDSIHVNVIDIGFYMLLALGTFIRIVSKQRRDSLFRFSIMVLFLLTAFNSILKIVMLTTYSSDGLSSNFSAGFLSIFFLHVTLAALSFCYLRKQKTEHYDLAGPAEAVSLLRRFVHYLIDCVIMIVVCFSLIPILFPILNPISNQFGERFSIWIFVLFARIIYYTTTEMLFKTSPGKILTGYFVVSSNKSAATSGQRFKRILFRFIPFEPFSAFKGSMWHDDLSFTGLARDKSNATKSTPFFLVIFLLLPIVVISTYYITKSKSEKHYARIEETRLNENFLSTNRAFSSLSTDHFIELAQISYPHYPVYVKIDSIEGDSIYGRYFSLQYSYDNDLKKAQDFYTANKDQLKYIVISRAQLKENIETNLNNRTKRPAEQYALVLKQIKTGTDEDASNANDGLYHLRTIHLISGIEFKNGSSTSSMRDDYLTFSIENEGMPGKITELKNTSGTFEWKSSTDSIFEGSLSFYCENFKRYKFYEFEFAVEDLAGRRSQYRVKGINAMIELTKID